MSDSDIHETISMPRREFIDLIEAVAERGARRALEKVGLQDEDAPKDLAELRDLLDSFRTAKRTAWQTIVKFFTTLFLGALLAGAAIKLKS